MSRLDEITEELRRRKERRLVYLQERRIRQEDRLIYRAKFNERQIEFNNLCRAHMEMTLSGLNQGGKTYDAGALFAMHALGDYSEWPHYTGMRFSGDILMLAVSESFEQVDAVCVTDLLGEQKPEGPQRPQGLRELRDARHNGWIPKSRIVSIVYAKQPRFAGQIDEIWVRRADGGLAKIIFGSYSQLSKRLQSLRVHVVWCEEEPPFDVFDELSARTNATGGYIQVTMCPESGHTQFYTYMQQETELRKMLRYGIEHCTHMDEQKRKTLILKYRGHPMAGPRLHGMPSGDGLCFPRWREILRKPFPIPANWPRVNGYDVPHQYGAGTTGAFACAWAAFDPTTGDREDPETMDMHIYRAVKIFGGSRADCVAACRGPGRHGDIIPGAFPHDAGITQQVSEDNPTSQKMREIFKSMGLNVIDEAAAFLTDDDKKTASKRLGVEVLNDAIIARKVFIHDPAQGAPTADLTGELDSFRMEDGKFPKGQNDHCSDAWIKARMMARFAEPLEIDDMESVAGYERESFDPMHEISQWGHN